MHRKGQAIYRPALTAQRQVTGSLQLREYPGDIVRTNVSARKPGRACNVAVIFLFAEIYKCKSSG